MSRRATGQVGRIGIQKGNAALASRAVPDGAATRFGSAQTLGCMLDPLEFAARCLAARSGVTARSERGRCVLSRRHGRLGQVVRCFGLGRRPLRRRGAHRRVSGQQLSNGQRGHQDPRLGPLLPSMRSNSERRDASELPLFVQSSSRDSSAQCCFHAIGEASLRIVAASATGRCNPTSGVR